MRVGYAKMAVCLQDMAMQGPAKGFGRKIPQVGFGITQASQQHNRFKKNAHSHVEVTIQYYFGNNSVLEYTKTI